MDTHPKTKPAIPIKMPAIAIQKAIAGLASVKLASPNAIAIKPDNDNPTETTAFQVCPVALIIVAINVAADLGPDPDPCPDPVLF